jgi:hypothetical protein
MWHSSFQHAVVRSINDKNAQLQKQLENLVREGIVFRTTDRDAKKVTFLWSLADSEISLLSSKLSGELLRNF